MYAVQKSERDIYKLCPTVMSKSEIQKGHSLSSRPFRKKMVSKLILAHAQKIIVSFTQDFVSLHGFLQSTPRSETMFLYILS